MLAAGLALPQSPELQGCLIGATSEAAELVCVSDARTRSDRRVRDAFAKSLPGADASTEVQLRKAQLEWVRSREGTCPHPGTYASGLETLDHSLCLAAETERRADQLEAKNALRLPGAEASGLARIDPGVLVKTDPPPRSP